MGGGHPRGRHQAAVVGFRARCADPQSRRVLINRERSAIADRCPLSPHERQKSGHPDIDASIRAFCDADHRIEKVIEADLRRIRTSLQTQSAYDAKRMKCSR